MSIYPDRRSFLKSVAVTGVGMSVLGMHAFGDRGEAGESVAVGMIGLDTSHSPAFTRLINQPEAGEDTGFRVVAAYPHGSQTIESSYSRIPQYTEEVKDMGVEIVDSIEQLLNSVDVVLLETNDGQPRREQAMQVIEAEKPMFMDKPVAHSLKDTVAIFEAAEERGVPVFSSSSLRYAENAQAIRHENSIGDVVGADVYSSAVRQENHPDLFWYGIHGVELIFTVMGTGCRRVRRTETPGTDMVVGWWDNDRMGAVRGIREGQGGIGGTGYGSDEIQILGPSRGYRPLVVEILEFFRTGVPPVSMEETLEIYAFMEAADESKRQGGAAVALDDVLSTA